MLRVTVVDATGAEHRFTVASRNEDYEVREDPTTGELVVEHVTYDRRGSSTRARTGSQVVGAWPHGTWQRACLHGPVRHSPEPAPDDTHPDDTAEAHDAAEGDHATASDDAPAPEPDPAPDDTGG